MVAELATGHSRGNRDCLLARLAGQQKDAADHFLGFGKGTVDDAGCPVAHLDACAARSSFSDWLKVSRPRAFSVSLKLTMLSYKRAALGLGAGPTLTRGFDDQQHVAHRTASLEYPLYQSMTRIRP